MMTLLLLLQADPAIHIEEQFVDVVIYENVAVTRVRLQFANRGSQHRELAATILAPEDAVAFELDMYGTVNADAQGHFAQERALAVYMQLTDAARNEAETPPNNPRTAEAMAEHAEGQVEAFKTEVAASHAAATGGEAKTTANRTVTITATKAGGTVHLEDTTTDGSITTRVRRPPAEPELLQQVGPGRFQLIMFPLPAGGRQTVELYFASRARGVEGAYEWTTPIKLLTGAVIDKRLVHLRVVAAGPIEDEKVTSHPKARRVTHKSGGKADPTRVEFRISGDRDEPVTINYRAAGFAEWGEGPATDPLLQPKRALDALATVDRIRAWMTEHPDAPILAREEQATAWAVEAGLVTPYSSIVLSEARLYPHIGLKPPAKNEEPFKSVRHPR